MNLLGEINTNIKQIFEKRYVGLLAFGSYFNKDEKLKGDGDIDLAIIINNELDYSSYDKIKEINDYLRSVFKENYSHAPFYSFTSEPNIINPYLYKLFFQGHHIIEKKDEFERLYDLANKSFNNLEPIGLSLSKEHTHFARRCLIDDILFQDEKLTNKIFKNHTTTAMRMLIHLNENKFISNSYDVWNYWLAKNKIMNGSESYNQLLKNLNDNYFKLDIHMTIVHSIKNYERNLKNERN